ncbi:MULTISPECIES: spore germination protein GerPE [unclassified Virgibacillus]|uniref:spore germination protein GerPE n=1 Tax=unclassified Virgibacillus TaxID=2620237 RepID=UPI0024DE9EE7|nr:spore germination protein GerPE [Virgibacillus sp. LDC-1]
MGIRTSRVKHIEITSIIFSGMFNIGDSGIAQPRSKAIAIQQPFAVFSNKTDETFAQFPLFRMKPRWNLSNPKEVHLKTTNHKNTINVQDINITGISQSGITQIGNLDIIDSESRIKHIRKLPGTNR